MANTSVSVSETTTTVTVSDTDATQVTIATVAPTATSLRDVALSATAPNTGEVLAATSATTAAWTDIDSLIAASYVDTAGDTMTGALLMAANVAPTTDGTRDLGTTTERWRMGYLDALTVTGDVAAATLTGTLATASQTNITGVGTLSAGAVPASLVTPATFGVGTYSFAGSTISAADSITATVFVGPLTGDVTGNVSGSSGSTTGNAATATALQTARTINGTSFDGTANVTVTAAAGTLTGTELNATVVTSSLTAIGTLASGAVPASLVTAGTFPSGAFAFQGAVSGVTTLTATTLAGTLSTAAQANVTSLGTLTALNVAGLVTLSGTPTGADGTLYTSATYGLTLRATEGSSYDFSVLSKTSGAFVFGIEGTTLSAPGDMTLTGGRLYVQGTSAASIIDRNLQVGNGALTSGSPRLDVAGTTTAASGLAQHLYVEGELIAAANSNSLYGARIGPTYTPGAYTGVTLYGLKIENVAGGATNYALHTGTGSVLFGGSLTASAGGSLTGTWTNLGSVTTVDINGGTIDATAIGLGTPAAGAFTTLGTSGTSTFGGLLSYSRNDVNVVGVVESIFIGNVGSGDVSLKMSIVGSTDWFLYVDNSDGDRWKVRRSSTDMLSVSEGGHLAQAATSKHYFDGVGASGDTYITESSANVLDLYAGGAKQLSLTATTATVAGSLISTGILSVDDATDTSSGVTGSIHTDGGLGVAKALYVGTTATIIGALTTNGGLQTFLANDSAGAGFRYVVVPNA